LDQAINSLLVALRKEIQAAAIPSDCKHTAVWCIDQLPALYAKLRQSSESRYGEEIRRLVQIMLKELVASKPPCPKAEKLAASIVDRLGHLHDEFGIPALKVSSGRRSSPLSPE
jgi:hypothetical protein